MLNLEGHVLNGKCHVHHEGPYSCPTVTVYEGNLLQL